MTFTDKLVGFKPWVAQLLALSRPFTSGYRRLDAILESAPVLRFDDHAKIILLSDVHRGNKGQGDTFRGNEALFLQTLTHYYQAGFTYIELGDGDDLWQTGSLGAIKQAYPHVFQLFDQFNHQDRLHFILGNHEVQGRQSEQAKKGEWTVEEGLVLEYGPTGEQILAVHGHQVDLWCDQLSLLTQQIVRFMGERVEHLTNPSAPRGDSRLGALCTLMAQSWDRWYASQL